MFMTFVGEEEPQWFGVLPPGSSAFFDLKDGGAYLEVPLWLYWLGLSRAHVVKAEAARRTDAAIDEIFENLKSDDVKGGQKEPGVGVFYEMTASMVVFTAAANAIDGFYGAVKPLISPPKSRARRHRQIIET